MTKVLTKNDKALLKAQLRLLLGEEIAFGPGKADLLNAIQQTGSISGAGKKMGMSYRRAWLLVDTMNRCFQQPLVDAAKGGRRGGGTQLTEFGLDVLEKYRALQSEIASLCDQHLQQLKPLLRKKPLPFN